jgi:hypothetical protein
MYIFQDISTKFQISDELNISHERQGVHEKYVGMLISLWRFLFAAQPKEFFLDGLKKLEQRSHKCVELRGEYVE